MEFVVYLSGNFDYFEVFDFGLGDFEAEEGADLVEALYACGSGVEGEHVVVLVVHDAEDVAMSAYEDFGFYGEYLSQSFCVVFAWKTTYVGHENLDVIDVEREEFGEVVSDVLPIDVAMHSTKWGKGAEAVDYVERADVASMPDFVAIGEIFFYFFVAHGMSVGH